MPRLSCRTNGIYYATFRGKRKYFTSHKTLAEQQYRRWLAEEVIPTLESSPVLVSDSKITVTILCAEYCKKFWKVQDRKKTAITKISALFGDMPVSAFRPNHLRAVRDALATDGYPRERAGGKIEKRCYSRTFLNSVVKSVVSIFRWGVSYDLVDPSVAGALEYVEPLREHESDTVEEPQAVLPVNDQEIDAVFPHLLETVADMLRVQRLTGMRPSEICEMRCDEIDRSQNVWTYAKTHHKNEWRGKKRIVPLGKRSQAILERYIKLADDGNLFLFSPKRALEALSVARRAKRKTKVQPSQVHRGKSRSSVNEHYTRYSYYTAIRRACLNAGIEPWSPNRIRHTTATEVRREYGLEGAQVILGHSSAKVSEIYAERDVGLAIEIAKKIG